MKRTSKIFSVKTYDSAIQKEIGGVGLYYAFGYDSEWTSYRIFVFNSKTYDYKILLKSDAAAVLDYYMDEPVDEKEEAKMIANINKKTGFDLT